MFFARNSQLATRGPAAPPKIASKVQVRPKQAQAASHLMGDQAQELQRLMGFFKLDEQALLTQPATAAPPWPERQARPATRSGLSPRPAPTKPTATRTPPVIRPVSVEKKAAATTASASEEWEEF